MADPKDFPLGTGLAGGARETILQRKCIRDKIIDGMDEATARKACSAEQSPTPPTSRMAKKKGGLVNKNKMASKKKSGRIMASSSNHKFSY